MEQTGQSAILNQAHRSALEWFEERRGQEIGWPAPTADGLFLMNKAKGIHKPSGWAHALSIRQSMGGPYADREIIQTPDGTWEYEYYQEGDDPDQRDSDFTNRALMRNIADGVPVGVVIQTKRKPGPLYRVLGLARVVGWDDGYFRLRGISLEPQLGTVFSAADESNILAAFSAMPANIVDARKRINAAIVARQGSGKFRADAISAFGGRCAISGANVPEVLEAAHIVPYLGPATNVLANTLLLRADLHTLFDRHLLAIDPMTLTVRLAPSLLMSSYASLEGAEVNLPFADAKPWQESLKRREQPLLNLDLQHGSSAEHSEASMGVTS